MKKNFLFVLLALLTLTVLCACGGGTKKKDGNGESNTSSGSTVVVGITNDMDSLDPHKAVAAGTGEVLYNIFEGLLKADANGVMQPAIAESYTISDDALTYTFKIRDGVRFHNGRELTTDDIIYSLNRVAGKLDENDIKIVSAFSIISDITALTDEDGKNEIRITLSEPDTEIVNYFDAAIIPADYKEQEKKPIGTGPFAFVSYSPMESIVVERFEDYYGSKPEIDGATFKIYAGIDDAFMELLAGKIDIFPYISNDQAEQLGEDYDIAAGQQSLAEGLYLNNAYEPLSDERVRQALYYAVDTEAIDEVLTGGISHVLRTGMFPGFKEYYEEETESYYSRDIKKAKELLKEAGYEGMELEIKVPDNYQLHVSVAEMIVDQLAEAGIKAVIKQVDWSSWLSDVYIGRDYQATVIALDATLAPSDVLRYYYEGNSSDFVNFNDDEFNRYYEAALKAVDQKEKAENYKKAQLVLTKKAASVWLMSPTILVAVNKNIEGYTFYPIYVQDLSVLKIRK